MLTLRLGLMQYLVATVFAALAVSFWMFQVANHDASVRWRRTTTFAGCRCPHRAACCSTATGKVLVENQNIINIALVREQTKDVDETLRTLAQATGAD